MWGALLCLTTATIGIDVGWEPLSEGGMKYVIRIDAIALRALADGKEIGSDVDARVKDIRAIRFRTGSDPLPQQWRVAAGGAPSGPRAADWPPSGPVWPATATTPGPWAADPLGKPLDTKAADPADPGAQPAIAQTGNVKNSQGESIAAMPSRPWWALIAVIVALAASLSWNVYLVWIYFEARYKNRLEHATAQI